MKEYVEEKIKKYGIKLGDEVTINSKIHKVTDITLCTKTVKDKEACRGCPGLIGLDNYYLPTCYKDMGIVFIYTYGE